MPALPPPPPYAAQVSEAPRTLDEQISALTATIAEMQRQTTTRLSGIEKRLGEQMEKMQAQETKMEGLVGETKSVAEVARWCAVMALHILVALGVMAFLNGV
ncbi:hypothetical protein VF21_02415 [Pseudogymnoascus sp. 05NY08]|nr:hypothetical protein VF21_02415 [Pseudogymnoascus sp. 05NY08]